MPKLPVMSGRDVAKRLGDFGFYVDHQTGSHMVLRNEAGRSVTVPDHKELKKGTLRGIIRQAGLEVAEFIGER